MLVKIRGLGHRASGRTSSLMLRASQGRCLQVILKFLDDGCEIFNSKCVYLCIYLASECQLGLAARNADLSGTTYTLYGVVLLPTVRPS